MTTDRDALRIPRIDSDPSAAFVSEAGTISASDAGYTESSRLREKLPFSSKYQTSLSPTVIRASSRCYRCK